MADKPTVLPKFAEDDQVDPVSGESNVYEPPENRKLSGWNRREIPPRQWFNWLHRLTYRWLLWAKEEIEKFNAFTLIGGDGINPLGDLSADRTVSVDGTVSRKVNSVRFDLGGDLAGTEAVVSKSDDRVVFTTDGPVSHANLSNPLSASSIPLGFRPDSQILFTHQFATGGVEVVTFNVDGSVGVSYRSPSDASSISKTGTTGAVSFSWSPTDETP